ncbi:unnamed protein product [Ixodes hexagonus]
MSRLADYFVVVGFDHEKERDGLSCGRIEQRFPEEDWDDTPFIEGIESFCQPQGWALVTARRQPSFFVAVLTDIDAQRHYCACLAFNEPVALTPALLRSRPDEEDEEEEEAAAGGGALVQHHSLMYAPKCLVLVSRLDCVPAFRNCLGIIYTVYIDSLPVQIETLVGNVLGCVQVPPPGGPQVRFSIGAGDRQALQPPLSALLPITGCVVYELFQQLGIHNVVTLFCAAMTELKILLHSRSYSRLNDACSALTSLMFPFKYSHVYIPLLPASLVEFLSTPTPFIMGVHSSLRSEVAELLDVLLVDLDGGSVFVPECVTVSMLPEPLHSQLYTQLCMVLRPELMSADDAFPPTQAGLSQPAMLDKEIRAIFLRTFAQLFQGYRSCLTIVRIHPRPFITFHKAAFLGQRSFTESEFVVKLLDCMFFNTFVAERGPPYRVCDVFDELYASMHDLIKTEARDPDRTLLHIRQLAQQLYLNENPNPQPYVEKIPKPTEGAFTRIHQPQFPKLDGALVKSIVETGLSRNHLGSKLSSLRPQLPRIVPPGPSMAQVASQDSVVSNSARRLEVLCNCINHVFDNKISDARKAMPAVLRALKSKAARLALTHELQHHVTGNKAVLEHQQFDLVVRLMNCALQDDSALDEHGVAAGILPLSHAFCRKLCTGVMQFAYTCIQDHVVWGQLQFWEAAFYQDVQRDIPAVYSETNDTGIQLWFGGSPQQMRIQQNASLSKEELEELASREESTVYSQAIHFANRMAALRVPLDASRRASPDINVEGRSNSNSIVTNSMAETDSADGESGFGEEDAWEAVGAGVVKFIGRFVDKVCHESGVTEEHVRALHQMVPGVVAIQQEMLEAVHRESKRLPPIPKPKILVPSLLQGEELVMEGLRAYLIPDGREEGTGSNALGGPCLLPAEGAVFLTNYRVLFKGTPLDPYACEQTVVRSFPVATLTKEKKIAVQYLQQLEQVLPEGLQLRSNTFQLMRVAFEDEVTSESIEVFRKGLNRAHCPPNMFQLFAFSGHMAAPPTPLHKKEKNATLTYAKRHILKTAMRAGFKPRPSSRKQKYVVQGPPMSARTLPAGGGPGRPFDHEGPDRPLTFFDDDASGMRSLLPTLSSPYPALVVVPQSVPDDSIRKLSRCYRHSRFPSVCWRHPGTKALLVRASGFHGKGVMGMLKGHPATSTSETSASIEQEKLVAALVRATPLSQLGQGRAGVGMGGGVHDSSLSISSLVLEGAQDNFPTLTPEVSRRTHNPFQKAVNSLRSSGGKGGRREYFSVFGPVSAATALLPKDWKRCNRGMSEFAARGTCTPSCCTLRRAAHCSSLPAGLLQNEERREETRSRKHAYLSITQDLCNPLLQLQCILQLSGAAVDLIDVQGSSVMLCLEDGWDFTCQVASVAQLCLDPYYRTYEGFRVLIEKEWLAFGHRFSYRGNQTAASAASGFAPIFLQFLDVVHQLLRQFPMSFEFNELFLRFLAYHHVSCRFRTFLLDSDGSDEESAAAHASSARASAAPSFWEYADRLWSKSSAFYNFWYSANLEDEVLRPYSNISNLYIWEYYLEETLEHGPLYDPELVFLERGQRGLAPDPRGARGSLVPGGNSTTPSRKILYPCYDDVGSLQVDVFTQLLEGLHDQEAALGHLPQKWHVLWNKLDRHPSFNVELVRSHGRAVHKRSTIEFLVRGKMAGGALEGGGATSGACAPPPQVYPHRFDRYNYTTPTYCDFCSSILWGLVKTGMHCVDCGYNCHEKCLPSVPKNCTKYKSVAPDPSSNSPSEACFFDGLARLVTGMHTTYYDQFSSHCPENRTHEGYLFKRGALLKGWKQRWFVLDSTKHQLRYYDAVEDSHCKGLIDLSEVISVTPAVAIQGAPKRADEKSFFDVKTSKRMYNFMAADASAAQEWIEKIQSCLQ